MSSLCVKMREFASNATASRVVEFLTEEAQTASEGHQLMQHLAATRPEIAHEVLCRLYDVACYKVGDSCFASEAPEDELEKWFVSTLVDETRFDNTELIPLADTLAAAQALAVEKLRLMEIFLEDTPQMVD